MIGFAILSHGQFGTWHPDGRRDEGLSIAFSCGHTSPIDSLQAAQDFIQDFVTRKNERTLSSRDLFKEITRMNLKAKSGKMITGGTYLHDQKDTNFCAYFATMSALRHQLRKIVGSEISGLDSSKRFKKDKKKYAGLEIKEYLERHLEPRT